jgi:hypothetical protein
MAPDPAGRGFPPAYRDAGPPPPDHSLAPIRDHFFDPRVLILCAFRTRDTPQRRELRAQWINERAQLRTFVGAGIYGCIS